MSKNDSSGLMSSAGLVRYFEEDIGIPVKPMSVVMFSVMLGVAIIILNIVF